MAKKHEVVRRIARSNPLINTKKKLIVELKNEFQVLADKDNWEENYKGWREPQKYTDILTKNLDLKPPIPSWLPLIDMFRTKQVELGISFSDIKRLFEVIGIKKLAFA